MVLRKLECNHYSTEWNKYIRVSMEGKVSSTKAKNKEKAHTGQRRGEVRGKEGKSESRV